MQAHSKRFEGGALKWMIAKTQESPKEHLDWKCVAKKDSYPLCGAAKLGLCEPVDCAKQARWGKCGEDFMRSIDWDTKTVTQHCAEHCPCPETMDFPVQKADSQWSCAAPKAAKPTWSDDEDSCCAVNAYSSSPEPKDACFSPFGKMFQVRSVSVLCLLLSSVS